MTLDDIRALGYTVEVAQPFEGEPFTVYRVEGFGVSTMLRDDDQEAIDSLADPDAHRERERQARQPSE
jgi:hypothetical protein